MSKETNKTNLPVALPTCGLTISFRMLTVLCKLIVLIRGWGEILHSSGGGGDVAEN